VPVMRPPTSLLKPIAFHTKTRQSIGCSPMFSPSGVVERVRRTSSPSGKSYRWINGRDGLEVRRTRRSKRKLAAKPQTTAFLRVQTSDSTEDSIEIKLPEAGQRPEAIGVREQPNSRKTLVRSSAGIQ
jgi:hypothetical protein